MQFHLNGFEPGDPEIFDPAERFPEPRTSASLPQEVDVLIVGCGPAGLTLAAQLAAFPDIKTCIVEQKPGRLLSRSGRWYRLPHSRNVPRLRIQRAPAQGSVLGKRDDLLEARRPSARPHCPQRPGPGRRRWALGISARHFESSSGARLLSGRHAQVAWKNRAVLLAAAARSADRSGGRPRQRFPRRDRKIRAGRQIHTRDRSRR